MKKLLYLTLFIASTFVAHAQWNGTDPLTTNSQVGISTPTPDGQQEIVQSWINSPYPSFGTFGFIKKDLTLTRIVANQSSPDPSQIPLFRPQFLVRTAYDQNFDPNNSTQYTTNFIIDGTGKTGVGIAEPLAQLHVLNTFLVSDASKNDVFKVTTNQIVFKNTTQELFKVNSNGYVYARKAVVTLTNPYPDFVFEKTYKLTPLSEVETYINKYHHLPNVKSETEVKQSEGIDVGEMQLKLLEKVEELTLYVIQQQKEINELLACQKKGFAKASRKTKLAKQ